jgi:RNA polymerase sigma-32 factor
MARTASLPIMTAEGNLSHYLEEIRRFPMLEPQQEYMLAKRWREHGDPTAAQARHQSFAPRRQDRHGISRLRLADFEVISEGNVGLMQAVKRFEPERFPSRHLRHVVDQGRNPRIHLALLVAGEDGHHGQSEEAVLQPAQGQEQNLRTQRGRLAPDQVATIAKRLGVTEQDVVDMNRRLAGDTLNAPIRDDGESGEWQDWLADDSESQETVMAAHEELDNRKQALTDALSVLNERERRIFQARRWPKIRSRLRNSPTNSASHASA